MRLSRAWLGFLFVPITATVACTALLGDFDVASSDATDGGSSDGSGADGAAGDGSGNCPGTQSACGTDCVDLQTTAAHCGTCDHACATGITCSGGSCDDAVVVMVAAGTSTCAGLRNGSLYCWGANDQGQVGAGDLSASRVATAIVKDSVNNPLGSLAALGTGTDHTCVAKTDGTPFCWGSTTFGETTVEIADDGGPLGVPSPTLAKQTDVVFGTVKPPIFFYKVLSIGPSATHQCGITGDGGLYCWGDNYDDQLGHVDAGFFIDQTCVKYGSSSTCSTTPFPAVTNLANISPTQVSTGASHTCVLDGAGNVFCWGYGKEGQLGNGSQFGDGPNPIRVLGLDGGAAQIASGSASNCALMKDGTVQCWGFNSDGELGYIGSTDAGDGCCGVEGCFGNSCFAHYTPIAIAGLSNVKQISVGYDHACAVEKDGSLWCWGANGSGQLGRGDTKVEPAAAKVPGLSNVAGVACGASFTCAWTTDGKASCWGLNDRGQLANGNVNSASPVPVLGIP